MSCLALVALLVLGCRDDPAPLAASGPTVRVVAVQDGDSLKLNLGAAEVKVRLFGIDAPEHRQPYGEESKRALRALVAGGQLRLVQHGTDIYGRMLVELFRGDDVLSINHHMVAEGHAWHFVKYSKDQTLKATEADARAKGLGLWAEASPQPPWEFRASRRGRSRKSEPATVESSGVAAQSQPPSAEPSGVVSPSEPATAGLSGVVSPSEGAGLAGESSETPAVIGNIRSRKYHLARCPGYRATAPTNRIPFESAEAAEEAGYKRAGNCP